MTKTVYAHDSDGRYAGTVTLDESDISPLEPGVFLIPGNCVEEAPPVAGDGQEVVMTEGEWVLRDLPAAEPEPEPEPTNYKAELVTALQSEMDAAARARGYDDLKTAITYRGDPNPKFAAEAEALFVWRSSVWTTAYSILEEVQAGARDFPTVEEVLSLMPALGLD